MAEDLFGSSFSLLLSLEPIVVWVSKRLAMNIRGRCAVFCGESHELVGSKGNLVGSVLVQNE